MRIASGPPGDHTRPGAVRAVIGGSLPSLVVVVVAMIAVVCVLATAAGSAAPGAPPAVSTQDEAPGESSPAEAVTALQEADIDADTTRLRADVDAGGDATWQVAHRLRLDTENEREAFGDLQDAIEADPSAYLDPFEERMLRTVALASNATDREMTVGEFAVSTRRESQPQTEFGVVTFQFEWGSFASTGGDEIRTGDALDRLFLATDESLEIRWPETHRHDSSLPDPDTVEDRRVVWRGPIDFDEGQPRVVAVADDDSFISWSMLALLLAGVVAGALLFVAVRWRYQHRSGPETTDASGRDPPASKRDGRPVDGEKRRSAGTTDIHSGEDETAPPETAPSTSPSADADSLSGGDPDEQSPPSELLRNEEQVMRLLERNGGRLKQKELADRLEWSAAKTSQVVTTLREEGELESFRIGRENVLTLPGEGLDVVTDEDDSATEDGATATDDSVDEN